MKQLLIYTLISLSVLAETKGTKDGRFQLIINGDEKFIVDSGTGKIWTWSCLTKFEGNCIKSVWAMENIEEITVSSKQYEKILEKAQKQNIEIIKARSGSSDSGK